MAHFAGGAVAVVGHGFHNDGDAAGAIAFIDDLFIVLGIAGTQGLVNGALDIIVGHIGSLSLGDNSGQLGVAAGITAAALLYRHDHLAGDLGEGLGTLGVCRTFGFLYVVPLGMS